MLELPACLRSIHVSLFCNEVMGKDIISRFKEKVVKSVLPQYIPMPCSDKQKAVLSIGIVSEAGSAKVATGLNVDLDLL